MLRMSHSRLLTKRRIAGNFGHLGNARAMTALEALALLAPNTKHLILAHISEDSNDSEILKPLAENALSNSNARTSPSVSRRSPTRSQPSVWKSNAAEHSSSPVRHVPHPDDQAQVEDEQVRTAVQTFVAVSEKSGTISSENRIFRLHSDYAFQ